MDRCILSETNRERPNQYAHVANFQYPPSQRLLFGRTPRRYGDDGDSFGHLNRIVFRVAFRRLRRGENDGHGAFEDHSPLRKAENRRVSAARIGFHHREFLSPERRRLPGVHESRRRHERTHRVSERPRYQGVLPVFHLEKPAILPNRHHRLRLGSRKSVRGRRLQDGREKRAPLPHARHDVSGRYQRGNRRRGYDGRLSRFEQ